MDRDTKPKVRHQKISSSSHGQRIDNFLFKILKGVPKTRVYKAVRSGEVRVNGSRIKVSYKLNEGDEVRIPPIRFVDAKQPAVIPPKLLDSIPILFEDEDLIVVDKPAGLAVHGGTGMQYGLIEAVRQLQPQIPYLELVHRLDRETSGCLMLAKNRKALLALQQQLGEDRTIGKFYIALVHGLVSKKPITINLAISKTNEPGKYKRSTIDNNGYAALSRISLIKHFQESSLVQIELKTGRMHQARVHCMSQGNPVAGDRLYSNSEFNRKLKKLGLGRMFLHAYKLEIRHPVSANKLAISANLPQSLEIILEKLDNGI